MIGSILLWILLGLLALLVLVLVLPAMLVVRYAEGELTVKLQVLFVRLTVFPMKERPAKPKKEKRRKKHTEEKEEEKTRKKRSVSDWIELIKRIAASAGAGLRFLLRRLRIRDVQLVLPVYGGDASETALSAGRVQALIGSTRAVLENLLNIRFTRLVVIPDFLDAYGERLTFSCKVLAAPVIMLAAGIVALRRFLRSRPRRRKRVGHGPPPPAQKRPAATPAPTAQAGQAAE